MVWWRWPEGTAFYILILSLSCYLHLLFPPQWPHNTGPLMTYMTSCGSTSCDQFDPTGAKWFKIDQLGKKDADTWYQADIREYRAIVRARSQLTVPIL